MIGSQTELNNVSSAHFGIFVVPSIVHEDLGCEQSHRFRHGRISFLRHIAETVAAFRNVTFGNNKSEKLSSENGFGFYGVDFVIDNDLDVWYLESQKGPGMEEDHDFRVEMHRDLLRSIVDIVEEVQLKLEVDPTASVLPINNLGGWDIVYAGTGDDHWMYEYKGYARSKTKKACGLPKKAPITETKRVRKRETPDFVPHALSR